MMSHTQEVEPSKYNNGKEWPQNGIERWIEKVRERIYEVENATSKEVVVVEKANRIEKEI